MSSHNLAVFPGTFDPLTLGHLDIIERSARLFSRLIIAVANSPSKHPLLSLEDRVESARQGLIHVPNVEVMGFSGMLIDFLKEQKADILVRGVRTVADYDYEVQLAGMYRTMMPQLEIVMLLTSGNLSFISSTLVREVITHKGDVSKFVPAAVQALVKKKYQQ